VAKPPAGQPGPLRRPPLDPLLLFRVLYAHNVRYIVIGAFAMDVLGITLNTQDIDICYEATPANTRALTRALRDLHAVPVNADDVALRASIDPRLLQLSDTFLFVTDAGRVDFLRIPDGTAGFDDLIRTASEYEIGGVPVVVPSLDDLIRMKRATNRPKDRIALELLGALRDELEGTPPPPTNPAAALPEANPPQAPEEPESE
jgi:hypothetical protein